MRMRWYAGSAAFFFLIFLTVPGSAQPRRITRNINRAERALLAGHMSPKARADFDTGRVAPSLELSYVTLTFAQTDQQKADLDRLLEDQQNAASANYHRWLTPEQYAERF